MALRRHVWLAAVAWLAVGHGPAVAQGSPDPFGIFGDRWQVGGLVYVSPVFEGAKSYKAIGFPFVAPAGLGDAGVVQVRGLDDVRFRLFQFSGFEFGPLAGYRLGRDEDDASRLNGLGDIDGGFVAGGFATYRSGPFSISASYHHQATGDETGGLVRFGAEHKSRPFAGWTVTSSIGTNYALEEYMTSFFGVSAAQSGTSGLPEFRPSAGFKDIHAGVTAAVDLNDRWTLMLIGRYAHLLGDAADSPIVETDNQFYGGLALSYKFDLRR